jgi:two-component system, OmpR family, sensor histidine kinase AdeS
MNTNTLQFRMTLATAAASLSSALVFVIGLAAYFYVSGSLEMGLIDLAAADLPAEMAPVDDWSGDTDPSTVHTAVIFGMLSFVSASIGGIVGFFAARRLARPIKAMAQAARTISKGDLSARAETSPYPVGEVGTLLRDFNQMAGDLAQMNREQVDQASAIAHELRTPVTVLRGRLQGLADGVFQPNKQIFEGMVAQTELLSRVIDDLRTLTLAQSGKLDFKIESVDVKAETEALLRDLTPMLQDAGFSVIKDMRSSRVNADPIRLRQAVSALIYNVMSHAAEGGIVEIVVGQTDQSVFVEVKDRGPGMSDAELSNAFDRFWRADASRARASGGSGLGLAVVKDICRGLGGHTTACRRSEGGLSFKIIFPAASGHTVQVPSETILGPVAKFLC